MMDFGDRHILITGGSTGIGRATAVMLSQRGARVSLIARSAGKLAATVAEIGDAAASYAADVGDKTALLAAIDQVEAKFGPVDGLFANAGTGGIFAPFTDYDDATWDRVLAVNLSGAFWAMKRVMRGMMERAKGSIVVTGSLASERGMANNPAYVASKHAVLGLARAAALEAAPHNVRVNCLLPGLIDTPLLDTLAPDDQTAAMKVAMGHAVPMGRIGTSEEAAEVATFLLSDAARHVTAQAWAVDGGMLGTLNPGE
jgi:NAD(P)-dependent dehydrogenase (short-subunit alcohol dehydrogenase family)